MCVKYHISLCKSKVMNIVLDQETKLFSVCGKLGVNSSSNEIIQHSRADRKS